MARPSRPSYLHAFLLSLALQVAVSAGDAARAPQLDRCPAPRALPMAFPERSCVRCMRTPQLWTMTAQPGFRATKIVFRNGLADEAAEVRWVDELGAEHVKAVIEPGRLQALSTWEGHVHRAYSVSDGRLLVEHMAGRRTLGSNEGIDMAKLESHGEHALDAPQGLNFRQTESKGVVTENAYRNFGFANTLSVVVQLFWRSEGTEHPIFELGPGETYFETTYPNHEWVARTRDGQLTAEFLAADVAIDPCPPQLAAKDFSAARVRVAEGIRSRLPESCTLNETKSARVPAALGVRALPGSMITACKSS